MRIFAFLLCAVTLCAFTLGAVSCDAFLHTLEYDKTKNLYTDKKTGVVYTDAPSYYEVVEPGEKYAKWASTKKHNVIFYTIDGADPELYLCEDGGTVFYSDKAKLPTLGEMQINEVYVCVRMENDFTFASITDAKKIGELINLWETGESIEYPGTTPEESYTVRFVSENYPWLNYSLVYVEYTDGAYLYCRETGRCVGEGDILRSYINGITE